MARQELDMSQESEAKRLELLWDAYKAQEDELMALQKDLESISDSREQYKARLAKEETRLQKLWDAYRVQEDELKQIKTRLPLMEEKLVERERTVASLQQDIELLEPLSKQGRQAVQLQREVEKLRADVEVLEARLKAKGDSAKPARVSGAAQELKQTKVELEQERERLEKLYSLYQDQEDEVANLKKTVKDWEAWAKKVRPALES